VRPPAPAPAGGEVIARVSGAWEGFIWGRELAKVDHMTDIPAGLTIGADGTWTLASGLGPAGGAVSTFRDGVLELDGRADSGRGPAVWLRLHLVRGGSLMGLVHAHFSGRTVVASIHLWRVSSPAAPRSPGQAPAFRVSSAGAPPPAGPSPPARPAH
jgi:hypothetical protein